METPLVFFVHVGKTGGTTVNRYLREGDPNGMDHCESIINQPELLREAANSRTWLSGHVPLDVAMNKLATATQRQVRYFTSLRNPVDQIASHYNWLIEIFHKSGDFYEHHPQNIKVISETLRSTDNGDVRAVIKNLVRFRHHFLNFQQRTVLGTGFNWNTGQVRQRLDTYELMADIGSVEAIAGRMLDKQFPTRRKENESRYHFDAAVFGSVEMKRFLARNNLLDDILYTLCKSSRRFISAPKVTAKA